MWPVGTITERQDRHRASLVTFWASGAITKLGPDPNYSLDPTFNDAEILFVVTEEHVACWYHHWTKGGSTDPVWLRFLASGTINKLAPGPNHSLHKTFNNAKNINGVIENM